MYIDIESQILLFKLFLHFKSGIKKKYNYDTNANKKVNIKYNISFWLFF